MDGATLGPYLIVNADDYGYFRCVSKGILETATHGIVTATGVLANAPHFTECAAWLRECHSVDVGNHLNLTYGAPLTKDMSSSLGRWSGRFPGKFALVSAILSRTIRSSHVRAEWRAQIDRCLEAGLSIRFLNSHEHVHIIPSLLRVMTELADEYAIAHVRLPLSGVSWNSASALLRSAMLKCLGIGARLALRAPAARFLGLDVSGRLDLKYLQRTIPSLRPGELYELMCHPGRFDREEVSDKRLLAYHDWEGELRALLDPAAKALLDQHCVRLVRYRDVQVHDGGFAISLPAA